MLMAMAMMQTNYDNKNNSSIVGDDSSDVEDGNNEHVGSDADDSNKDDVSDGSDFKAEAKTEADADSHADDNSHANDGNGNDIDDCDSENCGSVGEYETNSGDDYSSNDNGEPEWDSANNISSSSDDGDDGDDDDDYNDVGDDDY